ncbi:hypothetical protein VTI74DRAFT_3522 [Chaetomium olivicolor]
MVLGGGAWGRHLPRGNCRFRKQLNLGPCFVPDASAVSRFRPGAASLYSVRNRHSRGHLSSEQRTIGGTPEWRGARLRWNSLASTLPINRFAPDCDLFTTESSSRRLYMLCSFILVSHSPSSLTPPHNITPPLQDSTPYPRVISPITIPQLYHNALLALHHPAPQKAPKLHFLTGFTLIFNRFQALPHPTRPLPQRLPRRVPVEPVNLLLLARVRIRPPRVPHSPPRPVAHRPLDPRPQVHLARARAAHARGAPAPASPAPELEIYYEKENQLEKESVGLRGGGFVEELDRDADGSDHADETASSDNNQLKRSGGNILANNVFWELQRSKEDSRRPTVERFCDTLCSWLTKFDTFEALLEKLLFAAGPGDPIPSRVPNRQGDRPSGMRG